MIITIVGKPKVGKTLSSATFPKQSLLLDFDDGASSILHTTNSKGELVVKDASQITVEKFTRSAVYNLDFRTNLKGKVAPAHTAEAIQQINKVNQIIQQIANKEIKVETLIFDSLTTFFRLWKDALLFNNSQSTLQIQDYMTLESILFGQFIPTLRILPVKYIILIDHIDVDKDEITGMIEEFPVGPSRNMGRALSKEFDEVWLQTAEGDGSYKWWTRKRGLFEGAGSRRNLPNPITANFEAVKEYLK